MIGSDAGYFAGRIPFDLAKELGELGAWVRLHYVYPYPHVDDVVGLMAEGKILPYLDIPFQHASPTVLKAMRRPANQDKVLDRIKKKFTLARNEDVVDSLAREGIEVLGLFILGFPGESRESVKRTIRALVVVPMQIFS